MKHIMYKGQNAIKNGINQYMYTRMVKFGIFIINTQKGR